MVSLESPLKRQTLSKPQSSKMASFQRSAKTSSSAVSLSVRFWRLHSTVTTMAVSKSSSVQLVRATHSLLVPPPSTVHGHTRLQSVGRKVFGGRARRDGRRREGVRRGVEERE